MSRAAVADVVVYGCGPTSGAGTNNAFRSCSCSASRASGSPCPADLTGDGIVEASDLSVLLVSWGGAGGDLDGNGITDAADIAGLLLAWGACPP